MLSKSSFKTYLRCPAYFWFAQNNPDVLPPIALSDFEQMLADQGKWVEREFYKLFPDAEILSAKGYESVELTRAKVANGIAHMAQAGFSAADFFAQADMVHFKGDQHIDIYEIKSSSSMQNMGQEEEVQAPSKMDYINDLAFQYQVATLAGYLVDTTYLVELNKQYVRRGALDLHSLFNIIDVSEEVLQALPNIEKQMQDALRQMASTEQPTTCDCKYKPRKKQCPAFGYMHPDLTGYNVYDLAIGRSPKRLKEFIDNSIFRIEDIPAGTKMTDSFRDQVITWNENREVILADEISRILDGLVYPLYFLDYETTGPAVPVFDGTRPYQQIPFQYSLHRLQDKNSEVQHAEYVHPDRTPPMPAIIDHLRKDIGDIGTIVVWNKTFEKKCNENLAECVPARREFLLDLNNRIYDLMEIFSKHLYVHKEFRGSYSIKKVLPVLAPQLSYDTLNIHDGGKATTAWTHMISDDIDHVEKEQIKKDLLAYCKLDTLAMVEIFRKIG